MERTIRRRRERAKSTTVKRNETISDESKHPAVESLVCLLQEEEARSYNNPGAASRRRIKIRAPRPRSCFPADEDRRGGREAETPTFLISPGAQPDCVFRNHEI